VIQVPQGHKILLFRHQGHGSSLHDRASIPWRHQLAWHPTHGF